MNGNLKSVDGADENNTHRIRRVDGTRLLPSSQRAPSRRLAWCVRLEVGPHNVLTVSFHYPVSSGLKAPREEVTSCPWHLSPPSPPFSLWFQSFKNHKISSKEKKITPIIMLSGLTPGTEKKTAELPGIPAMHLRRLLD